MSEKSTKSASVGESEAKGGLSVKISLLVYLIALASIILGKFDKFVSYCVTPRLRTDWVIGSASFG